jgi:asparagine synthase (glutamine-hydrolysing)
MSAAISHRGPDDSGVHVAGPIGFGFRRLAIIDLSPAGHQPMITPDGRHVLVFNGEIYNYLELQAELEQLGHRFRTHSDTEVLLAAYRQWGTRCIERMNGMWAFLIHDTVENTVFGSRDRFGQKPLFRARVGDALVIASEIKAIVASGLREFGPNWDMVSRLLLKDRLENVLPDGETFYDGIEEIPAGSAFELSPGGRMREWRYYTLDDVEPRAVDDPAGAFAELFTDAVRIHSRADVRVGVSLSGGLDSSSIACVLARVRDPRLGALQTFSYQSPEFDETAFVRETLKTTGADFHQISLSADEAWDGLPRVLAAQDEPVHAWNSVIGYKIFATAARHDTKVLLNGQGADETLGGYLSYFPEWWASLVRHGRLLRARREIGEYHRVRGGDGSGAMALAAKRAARRALDGVPAVRARAGRRADAALHGHGWYRPELVERVRRPRLDMPLGGTLNDMLRASTNLSPLPLYLRIEDRNSMAHSIETRLPFLDHRLVELAFALPDDWKLRGPWNKYVLRQAMTGILPDTVRERVDKWGFPFPLKQWIAGPLHDRVRDLLSSAAVRERGIYDVAAITRALERHRAGEVDAANSLFNIVQVETWFRTAHSAPSPARPQPLAASVA